MALTKGARAALEWLKNQKAGDLFDPQVLLEATGWSEASLRTYISKNKLAPFIVLRPDGKLRVQMDGTDISDRFFDETFTQTAPRKIGLQAGDILIGDEDDYQLVEPIGKGAVGHVWSAKPQSKKVVSLVALKIMLPREDLLSASRLPNVRKRFYREAVNGKALRHPNVVQYLDHGIVEKNPFLTMELARSSVGNQIRDKTPLDPIDAADIVRACIDGLAYLHHRGSLHRDVKPHNILMFDQTFKLGDLGIVKWADFDERVTKGGTITRASVQLGSWFYMAPEQQTDPHEAITASDIYSLGVSWIEMLSASLPSPHAVAAGDYDIPMGSGNVRATITQMVAYRPSDRPSLDEIAAVLD